VGGLSTKQPGAKAPPEADTQRVRAKYPNHLWHVDITVVPTAQGFWVPWLPFSLPNVWPFPWHVGVVLDHFSRRALAVGVFLREPSSAQSSVLMARAVERAGRAPKYLVSDKGNQFFDRDEPTQYQLWCAEHGVKTRFGAVGKKGSIAVVERFILSMKAEGLTQVIVPIRIQAMIAQVQAYAGWYNAHRPHTALGGRTPDEVFGGITSERERPRLEKQYPLGRPPARAAPKALRGKRGVKLELVVTHHDDRSHLPVVELRRAA
jgi:transposase InsO family protein